MSFPKQGYYASSDWAAHFKRRDEAQRTGRSLTKPYADYVERMQAKGQEPLTFTRWVPRKDEV